MSKSILLFEGHTAKFSDHSLKHVLYTYPYGDEPIRAKCHKYLQLHSTPVLVDVGASIGLMTMVVLFHPFAQAIAIEPYPVALTYLQENIALNGLADRIRVEPYALSDQGGIASLVTPTGENAHIGWSHIAPVGWSGWKGEFSRVSVSLRTLDSFELPKITVLKIDTEAHEHKTILGGRESIDRCQPIIVVETNPKGSHVLDLLQNWGYEIFDVYCADVWLRPKGK